MDKKFREMLVEAEKIRVKCRRTGDIGPHGKHMAKMIDYALNRGIFIEGDTMTGAEEHFAMAVEMAACTLEIRDKRKIGSVLDLPENEKRAINEEGLAKTKEHMKKLALEGRISEDELPPDLKSVVKQAKAEKRAKEVARLKELPVGDLVQKLLKNAGELKVHLDLLERLDARAFDKKQEDSCEEEEECLIEAIKTHNSATTVAILKESKRLLGSKKFTEYYHYSDTNEYPLLLPVLLEIAVERARPKDTNHLVRSLLWREVALPASWTGVDWCRELRKKILQKISRLGGNSKVADTLRRYRELREKECDKRSNKLLDQAITACRQRAKKVQK